jgi:hypothetical protein
MRYVKSYNLFEEKNIEISITNIDTTKPMLLVRYANIYSLPRKIEIHIQINPNILWEDKDMCLCKTITSKRFRRSFVLFNKNSGGILTAIVNNDNKVYNWSVVNRLENDPMVKL